MTAAFWLKRPRLIRRTSSTWRRCSAASGVDVARVQRRRSQKRRMSRHAGAVAGAESPPRRAISLARWRRHRRAPGTCEPRCASSQTPTAARARRGEQHQLGEQPRQLSDGAQHEYSSSAASAVSTPLAPARPSPTPPACRTGNARYRARAGSQGWNWNSAACPHIQPLLALHAFCDGASAPTRKAGAQAAVQVLASLADRGRRRRRFSATGTAPALLRQIPTPPARRRHAPRVITAISVHAAGAVVDVREHQHRQARGRTARRSRPPRPVRRSKPCWRARPSAMYRSVGKLLRSGTMTRRAGSPCCLHQRQRRRQL